MKTAQPPTALELQEKMFLFVDASIRAMREAVDVGTITKERGAAMIDRLLDVRSESVSLAPAPRRRKAVAK